MSINTKVQHTWVEDKEAFRTVCKSVLLLESVSEVSISEVRRSPRSPITLRPSVLDEVERAAEAKINAALLGTFRDELNSVIQSLITDQWKTDDLAKVDKLWLKLRSIVAHSME